MLLDDKTLFLFALTGLGATVLMDLWGLFLKQTFRIQSLDYALVGRWLIHMTDGHFTHPHIARASPRQGERLTGWLFHFASGITFGFLLLLFRGSGWMEQPDLLSALLVGLATVVFPFFIMQPAFGFGIAACATPSPMKARIKSLTTHSIFGLGLYITALGINMILQ